MNRRQVLLGFAASMSPVAKLKLSPVAFHALAPLDHVPIKDPFGFERTMEALIRKLLPSTTSPELLKMGHEILADLRRAQCQTRS